MTEKIAEPHVFNQITLTPEEVLRCQYSVWYPRFRKHAFPSHILNVPQAFVAYLNADGIRLSSEPAGVTPTSARQSQGLGVTALGEGQPASVRQADASAKEGGVNHLSATQEDYLQPSSGNVAVTTFKAQLASLFAVRGVAYAPKLNWSAPKDAVWIMLNRTMECRSVDDVHLMLKASSHINHDLNYPFEGCSSSVLPTPEFELVLRKWQADLNPALEFRVYVKNKQIVGISQRDLNYYNYLESLKDDLTMAIERFYDEVLYDNFESPSFTFDVYVPRPFSRVVLVDINPWSRTTDPLLFTWHELLQTQPETDTFDYEFRLLSQANIARFAAKEHSENQVPKDLVDASLDSSKMAELALKWRALLAEEDSEDDSENDSEDGP